jgi:hypothetical protein
LRRAALSGEAARGPSWCRRTSARLYLGITFNRGASFNTAGPRYAEMRQIHDCVKAGRLERIPGLIRSMKRLWRNSRGLPVKGMRF